VLGFKVAVERPEREFAYLTRDGRVDLMLQWADGPRERLRTASLERPYGRGVSLMIPCDDVGALFSAVVALGGEVMTPIEERHHDFDVVQPTARWPQVGSRRIVNRQFVVADPAGYLLRFYTGSVRPHPAIEDAAGRLISPGNRTVARPAFGASHRMPAVRSERASCVLGLDDTACGAHRTASKVDGVSPDDRGLGRRLWWLTGRVSAKVGHCVRTEGLGRRLAGLRVGCNAGTARR